MKNLLIFSVIASIVFTTQCSSLRRLGYSLLFKKKLTINQVIAKKEIMDKSDNPAFKHLIVTQMRECRIVLKKVTVQEVAHSSNIDYQFCIIVKVPYSKGEVDCYIYTKDFYGDEDLPLISNMKKGSTQIDVEGDFDRFFSLLDDAYTKIEIVNAIVSVEK